MKLNHSDIKHEIRARAIELSKQDFTSPTPEDLENIERYLTLGAKLITDIVGADDDAESKKQALIASERAARPEYLPKSAFMTGAPKSVGRPRKGKEIAVVS